MNIGTRITITHATNPSLVGIRGTVVNETKNTITINGKTLIKDQIITVTHGEETNQG